MLSDTELLRVAASAARSAAATAKRAAPSVSQIGHTIKSDGSIATEVDVVCSKQITDFLSRSTPSIPVFSEENDYPLDKQSWVIDPLDGTTNFSRGIPFWCVSISFLRDGAASIGVVYDVLHDEIFEARKNAGAWFNGAPLFPTESNLSKHPLLVFGHTSVSCIERLTHVLSFAKTQNFLFRAQGAGALSISSIAIGRADAFFEDCIHLWDIAAADLILREAGGVSYSSMDLAKPRDSFKYVAANAKHQAFGQNLWKLVT